MTVFIDTGVFYAHHDRDTNRHDTARSAISTVLGGEFGKPLTSDYVYDEAVTLMYSRGGDVQETKRLGYRIRGADDFPAVFELLFVGESGFRNAVELFDRYDDHGISFTDATIAAQVERHDIDHVLTFDDDFDGIVSRLDPHEIA